MWQTAAMEVRHEKKWCGDGEFSKKKEGPIANRPAGFQPAPQSSIAATKKPLADATGSASIEGARLQIVGVN
jgi:hypothetical protein